MGLPWELARRMDGGQMWYRIAADLVVAVHLLFISFVVGGAFLAWRWPRIIWAHLPAMVYGALVEFTGFTCPLTPLENYLRHRAGDAGYRGGFIAHYLVAVIYPPGLTRGMQLGRPGAADCDRRVLGLFASACTRQAVGQPAPGSSPRLAVASDLIPPSFAAAPRPGWPACDVQRGGSRLGVASSLSRF